MTTTEARPAAPTPSVPDARSGNPWRPTLRGVGLVARIELLRRRPSKKGYVFYGIVLAFILGLGILVAAVSGDGLNSAPMELVLILVLGAGMLIAPSLSATSINGDSGEGVLAPLQMTHLTAGDLAFGKLLASWLISFAVLATTTPFLVYAFSRSGWYWYELATVLGVILFVVLTATAVGLAWSAIAARAVASVSLAHLTTGFFVIGTLVIFAFTLPLVSEEVTVTNRWFDWEAMTEEQTLMLEEAWNTGDFSEVETANLPCTEEQYVTSVAHRERTAWLVLVNPIVVIGESSPIVDPVTYEQDGRAEPGLFAMMHQSVASAQIPPDLADQGYDECADASGQHGSDSWAEEQQERANFERAPWLGLAVQALLFVGSMVIVLRRLRVPYRKMRTGTRVA